MFPTNGNELVSILNKVIPHAHMSNCLALTCFILHVLKDSGARNLTVPAVFRTISLSL